MIHMPSASFVSAGGYHHHIGMNIWAGMGVPAPPEDAARLLSYELALPTQQALIAVVERACAAGIPVTEQAQGWALRDPSHNCVLLRNSVQNKGFKVSYIVDTVMTKNPS